MAEFSPIATGDRRRNVQSGTQNVTAGVGAGDGVVVTFPINRATTTYKVQVSVLSDESGSDHAIVCWARNRQVGTFKLEIRDVVDGGLVSSNLVNDVTVVWEAWD